MLKPLKTTYSQQDIKEFAEGNLILEEILLDCFYKNIPTHACCAGHIQKDGKTKRPYLSFLITAQTKDFISFCLEHEFVNGRFVELTLMFVDYPDLKKTSVSFALRKGIDGDFQKQCQEFFGGLKKVICQFDHKPHYSPKLEFLSALKQKFCRLEIDFKEGSIAQMFVQTPKIIEVNGFKATQKGIFVQYENIKNTSLNCIKSAFIGDKLTEK